MTRLGKMAMASSKTADLQLGELYRNTIEEFKKKLYDKKETPTLVRINERHRPQTTSPHKRAASGDPEEHRKRLHEKGQKSTPKKRSPRKSVAVKNPVELNLLKLNLGQT